MRQNSEPDAVNARVSRWIWLCLAVTWVVMGVSIAARLTIGC